MKLGALPLSLRQLQYVVAVAEELSFSKAAVRCSVSQPSLSGQIAELEDALGARLFERDHRKVLLTALGEQVVARARAVLREVDAIVELAQSVKEMTRYAAQLGSITQGQGSYTMDFSHYDVVPGNVQQQIVAKVGKIHHEDDE